MITAYAKINMSVNVNAFFYHEMHSCSCIGLCMFLVKAFLSRFSNSIFFPNGVC